MSERYNLKKRIRNKVPVYKKVYSVYKYDRLKYTKIFKNIQKVSLRYSSDIFKNTNPYKVLRLCYLRDKNGKLQSLGDQKHIFRYKVLNNVLKEISEYLFNVYKLLPQKDVLLYLFKRTHLVVYNGMEESQSEFLETHYKSPDLRLKVHISLLRNLKKGYEIEQAVYIARKKYNLPIINNLKL